MTKVIEKWVTFGDSITWYDRKEFLEFTKQPFERVFGYQYYLEKFLPVVIENQGISGDTMQDIYKRSIKFNYDNFDGVLFFGGVNNFNKMPDSTFGEIKEIGAEFDTTTFCGSYQAMLEDVIFRYPRLNVLIVVPYKVWKQEAGVMPEKYHQAIIDIASLYSIPTCDLYRNSGLNELNFPTFFVDNPEKVSYYYHLNNLGYEKIAPLLIEFLAQNMKFKRGS